MFPFIYSNPVFLKYNSFNEALDAHMKLPYLYLYKVLRLEPPSITYFVCSAVQVKNFKYKNVKRYGDYIYEYIDFTKPFRPYFYVTIPYNTSLKKILNYIASTLQINYDDIHALKYANNNQYTKPIKKVHVRKTTSEYHNIKRSSPKTTTYRIILPYVITEYQDIYNILYRLNLFDITSTYPSTQNFVICPMDTSIDYFTERCKSFYPQTSLNNIEGFPPYIYNITVSNTIISRYVKPISFDTKTLFIKSPMGSGKTTAVVQYIKQNLDKSILIISSRISLIHTIYSKLLEENIPFDNYLYSKLTPNMQRLIISINSLLKLPSPLQKYDIIWLDEAVSLMTYIGFYPFGNKQELYLIFHWLINTANKLLITDADLNDNSIDYYSFNYNYTYDIYKCHQYPNTVNFYHSVEDLLNLIINDLDLGKNVYIATDTKQVSINIYNELIKYTDKIFLYNSDSTVLMDKEILTINDSWIKYRVIIVTPKIIYGVDFNKQHFHKSYGFYKGNTITAREAIQQLHRIRTLYDREINVYIKQKKSTPYLLDNKYDIIKFFEQNLSNYTLKKFNKIFYNQYSNEIYPILYLLDFIIDEYGYKKFNINNQVNKLILYSIIDINKSGNNFFKYFIELFNELINN